MALGRKNQGQSEYKLKILKIINKLKDAKTQKDIPLMPNGFQVREKNVDGKWESSPNIEYAVSGDLTRITFDTGEYEGKPYDIVKLFLTDKVAKETYLVENRMSFSSRNIFNCLLALENFHDIEITLYKKEGKNGEMYSNVGFFQAGNFIKGKFTQDELPQPLPVKNSKGQIVSKEYDELNSFYLTELKAVATAVNGKTAKSVGVSKPTHEADVAADTSSNTSTEVEVNDEDVPF